MLYEPSPAQRAAINSVMSIFETGRLPSPDAYGTATVLPDGAGISYGIHQSTDRSDILDEIMKKYATAGGKFSTEIAGFLPDVEADFSTTLGAGHPRVQALMALLRRAGTEDGIMRTTQDNVFRAKLWEPTRAICQNAGLTCALSWLVVYDTVCQSGPSRVTTHRNDFPQYPPAKGGDEHAWTRAYIGTRLHWIRNFESSRGPEHTKLVRNTDYRAMALDGLADGGHWALIPPFKVGRSGVTVR
jgi:hypothetical protein